MEGGFTNSDSATIAAVVTNLLRGNLINPELLLVQYQQYTFARTCMGERVGIPRTIGPWQPGMCRTGAERPKLARGEEGNEETKVVRIVIGMPFGVMIINSGDETNTI